VAGFHFYDLIFPLFVFLLAWRSLFAQRLIATKAALRRSGGCCVAPADVRARPVLLWRIARPIAEVRLLACCSVWRSAISSRPLFIYVRPRNLVAICVGLLSLLGASDLCLCGLGAGDFAKAQSDQLARQHFLPDASGTAIMIPRGC